MSGWNGQTHERLDLGIFGDHTAKEQSSPRFVRLILTG